MGGGGGGCKASIVLLYTLQKTNFTLELQMYNFLFFHSSLCLTENSRNMPSDVLDSRSSYVFLHFFVWLTSAAVAWDADGFNTPSLSRDLKAPGIVMKWPFMMILFSFLFYCPPKGFRMAVVRLFFVLFSI